jgi:hypothetical protein
LDYGRYSLIYKAWTVVFLPMAIASLIFLEVIMTLWPLRGESLQSKNSAAREAAARDLAKVHTGRHCGGAHVVVPRESTGGGGFVQPRQPMMNIYRNGVPTAQTEGMGTVQKLKMNLVTMAPHQGVVALEVGGSAIAPGVSPIVDFLQLEQQQQPLQLADYVQHLQQHSEAQQQQISELQRRLQQQQQQYQ